MDAEKIIDAILRREGGYVNHPKDRGGPTKYGITKATLSRWRGYPVGEDGVAALTEEEARQIYRDLYVDRPRFGEIRHRPLRELVVDCGVNHGVRRAARWLQQAAGVKVDGIVGPVTLAAVNRECDPTGAGMIQVLDRDWCRKLYRRVLAKRIEFYGEIIAKDPSQAVFAHGWMRRAAEFVKECP